MRSRIMQNLLSLMRFIFFVFVIALICAALDVSENNEHNGGMKRTHSKHAHNGGHSKIKAGVHRRCGGHGHALNSRPCPKNDTYCGDWDLATKFFTPVACYYDNISGEQARKCLGNRTLAFIGDSQIRDISVGVAFLLSDVTLETSPREKFDYKHSMDVNATRIQDFKSWNSNVPGHNYNGHIFPKADIAKEKNWEWQVQVWSLFRNEYVKNTQVTDVLSNKMSAENSLLRPIDLAFWAHGLHDWGWWENPPYGEHFYDTMVKQWLGVRLKVPVPTIWVSMNNNCREKLQFSLSNKMDAQTIMVEEANKYVNKRLLKEKMPYWDAAAALRTPTRCNVSDDGLHVKMFVDIMRAKMLFNHLCDADMNWRGSTSQFI